MNKKWAILSTVLLGFGCTPPQSNSDTGGVPTPTDNAPTATHRIVSLDYCADQYVLALAKREDILALSKDSTDSYAYYRDLAKRIPQTTTRAEDVLARRPDLVVRTYGGGANAAALYERVGIPVVQIGYAYDLPSIQTVLLDVGQALGEVEKAQALVDDMNKRLDAIPPQTNGKSVMYLTQGGVTAGTGTLIDIMLTTAGFSNFQTRAGWQSFPLERLAQERPDIVATSFFNSEYAFLDHWSPTRHSIIQNLLDDKEVVELDPSWTSCGAWFLIDAIEALAKHGDRS